MWVPGAKYIQTPGTHAQEESQPCSNLAPCPVPCRLYLSRGRLGLTGLQPSWAPQTSLQSCADPAPTHTHTHTGDRKQNLCLPRPHFRNKAGRDERRQERKLTKSYDFSGKIVKTYSSDASGFIGIDLSEVSVFTSL